MKIILTGGLGFIGTALIERKSKHQFIVCTKNVKKNMEKFKNVIFEIVKIESENFSDVIKKHKPDLVIHLASYTGLQNCEENPSKAFTTNVYGTHNIINSCLVNKIRLMFLSSKEVYGMTTNDVEENHLLKPTNVYGITKKLAEEMIVFENKKSNLVFTILRVTNVYGPGSTKGVNKMIQSAIKDKKLFLNGGDQSVNLIFIDKLVDVIFNIINDERTFNQIFNVGSFENISIKEFANIISKIEQNNIKIIQRSPLKYENRNFKPNLNKLNKIIDLSTKMDLHEGIIKTKKWFKELDENRNEI
jgi:UDP-glucose 4-epimerase